MNRNIFIGLYIFASLLTIAILTWQYVECKNKKQKDSFCYSNKGPSTCFCKGVRDRVCQNSEMSQKMYNMGYTEYQNFNKTEPNHRNWPQRNPGDYDWNRGSKACEDSQYI
jgi:hypothetical protein